MIRRDALRRKRGAPTATVPNPDPEKFETGPLGFLVLKRKPGETITLAQVQAAEKALDEEELNASINPARKRHGGRTSASAVAFEAEAREPCAAKSNAAVGAEAAPPARKRDG